MNSTLSKDGYRPVNSPLSSSSTGTIPSARNQPFPEHPSHLKQRNNSSFYDTLPWSNRLPNKIGSPKKGPYFSSSLFSPSHSSRLLSALRRPRSGSNWRRIAVVLILALLALLLLQVSYHVRELLPLEEEDHRLSRIRFYPKKLLVPSKLSRSKPPPLFATIYRIIGNDLPPRHSPGQTLVNLKFILDYENSFEDCRKVWILNRLVDSAKEQDIIRLLEQYHQPYLRIPFDPDAYRQVQFRYEDFRVDDFFYSESYLQMTKNARMLAVDHTYHDKNLYVMNNNGARNLAIDDGRHASRWIFPFDGNCFITEAAWAEIRRHLTTFGDRFKYFIIPMVHFSSRVHFRDYSRFA